ncbi:Vitamin K-dependent gamma-carboxylase [hydrothermal vent metagenome]|uniref:Vitamin K-dependent gamma-carboxylase n=1 Tax=hydrothermal vent metagenome TaxID=652676 RepID=A0A3B0VTL5_9ZZZZ
MEATTRKVPSQKSSQMAPTSSWGQAVRQWLQTPVDIAVLVYFRIAFGAIMIWEMWRYTDRGWISRYWIEPSFNFTYYGFDWVQPWPGIGMYIHFGVMALLALFILLGLWYRFSTILFFLGFSYIFLLEQAQYLNHFYLIILISFIMIFLPANRAFSVDAWRSGSRFGKLSASRSDWMPGWSLWLLRFQIAVPYFFGGIAKLNGDWLQAQPMEIWLASRTDFPLIGQYFTEKWMVYGISYGGLLLDLLVVPFLLWRKTRPFAFIAALTFHLMNVRLFSIGIFPWFMIAATAVFFDPSWPRQLLKSLGFSKQTEPKPDKISLSKIGFALLASYVLLQILLPLRHYIIPGNVSWTEDGHRFAWHMKLRDKDADITFFITDEAGERWQADSSLHLTARQQRKMSTRPYMVVQYAHFLAAEMAEQGQGEVVVQAEAWVSLNGRSPQQLIDPTVNLAAQPRTIWPVEWVLPLTTPLFPNNP